ncbi:MAG: outer membrane beta-barrel protein [Paludibacteraceae bacterium]|nr:outer membrane beta-barrel protein [Paludibacteraceae bacterium]
MKKIFITIALALVTATVCTAQFFVGANLGLSSHSAKNEIDGVGTVKSPSSFGLNIAPKFGYYFNPKFAVGLSGSFGLSDSTIYTSPTKTKDKYYTWSVSPFVRYAFLQFGKFSVLAETNVYVAGSSSKYEVESSVDGPSTIGYGVNVAPILSFDVSKKFSLETKLNFLKLGYSYSKIKTPAEISSTATEQNYKQSGFDFGVNTNDILNVGDVTIGAIYKF